MSSIADFMEKHYKHFNARETVDAAKAWVEFLEKGNKMFLTLAGAMSTAELGISLAEMIRQGKVHAISCTGANLEEDIFNAIAHKDYKMIPNYRDLSPEEEDQLRKDGWNRVTDTCIPEDVLHKVEKRLIEHWQQADRAGESYFPCEYIFKLIEEGFLDQHLQIPREHSWIVAAYEAGIPVYTPGWEDSTLGNMFTACVMDKENEEFTISRHSVVRSGTEQFEHLIQWYQKEERHCEIGFFQIGGGIAGDFAICTVPCIIQDVWDECKFWGYFCQISDSTTSYGSYSGAVPNEKITWWKLDKDAPKFMINSDASIVAPLIFQYVLERSKSKTTKATQPKKKLVSA